MRPVEVADADRHPFVRAPHRALAALALPVLLSLLAEPLTGLADTFFVAWLGAAPLAALGVSTTLLSGLFWVFNFLGIGTQTSVARAHGEGELQAGRDAASLAFALAALLGALLALVAWPLFGVGAEWMGAEGARRDAAVAYLRVRMLGAPAVLMILVGFHALRGMQDMRTPLGIAVAVNAANIALDPLLIFGWGPVPALGIAGAAWASIAAQWAGALWALAAVRSRLGLARSLHWRDAFALLVVGRDLVLRTGLLLLFQVLATRAANRAGVAPGAAHQAVRQFWLLTAFVLDAYAAAAQSLVGYFLGAARPALARRAARVSCQWAAATGAAIAMAAIVAEPWIAAAFVPAAALAPFGAAWLAFALAQPLNALAFATDGIHWGTGDYTYLRNGMIAATGLGILGLATLDLGAPSALAWIWIVTGAWITVRAAVGVARVWPGVGRAPLGRR